MSGYTVGNGLSGPVGPLDPEQSAAYALALQRHGGRYLVVPRTLTPVAQSGSDWYVQVPMGMTWVVLGISGLLSTGVGADTVNASVVVYDGGNLLAQVFAAGEQTSSWSGSYSWVRGCGYSYFDTTTHLVSTAGLWTFPLWGGLTVGSYSYGLDAGDNWTNIVVSVLEVRQRTNNERAQYAEELANGTYSETYPGLLIGV